MRWWACGAQCKLSQTKLSIHTVNPPFSLKTGHTSVKCQVWTFSHCKASKGFQRETTSSQAVTIHGSLAPALSHHMALTSTEQELEGFCPRRISYVKVLLSGKSKYEKDELQRWEEAPAKSYESFMQALRKSFINFMSQNKQKTQNHLPDLHHDKCKKCLNSRTKLTMFNSLIEYIPI